jgi:glycosyltransferase involved in cell wall biosynthesis
MKKINKVLKKKNFQSVTFVIPIFNEEKRLPFLFKNIKNNINKYNNLEIIFVNDGSTDNSKYLIKNFINLNKKKNKNVFKFLSYKTNKGKGYALKKGVLFSCKKWILTLDADLSVDFSQLNNWFNRKYLFNDKNLAYFGSRLLKKSDMKAIRIRKLIGHIFRILEKLITKSTIRDTQCGFKLYHNFYAKEVFMKLKTKGFAHDIELVYLLRNKKINIIELPIKWVHKPYSKINLFLDSVIMIIEIFKIRSRFQKR